jgi:hypothetical protein
VVTLVVAHFLPFLLPCRLLDNNAITSLPSDVFSGLQYVWYL